MLKTENTTMEFDMYHIFRSGVGKVLFVIDGNNSIFKNFAKGKTLLFTGSKIQCEDTIGSLYPESRINHVK